MYLKPGMVMTQDGLVPANIPDPDRRDRLPAEGRDVPVSPYWLLRVREGGAVHAEPPQQALPAPAAVVHAETGQ